MRTAVPPVTQTSWSSSLRSVERMDLERGNKLVLSRRGAVPRANAATSAHVGRDRSGAFWVPFGT
jgi:hypothetical protein